MRSRLALFAAFVAAAAPAHAQFTLEHYAKVARVSDLRVAPQGDRAVFTLARPNYEANTWESDLVQLDLRTRALTPLTHRKTAATPRWSPSGDRLAFLASVEGRTQLFVLAMAGGEARQVTRAPNGVITYEWKPDGSAFAYTSVESGPERGKYDDAFEVDQNDYLTTAAPRPTHPWVISAAGGEARKIASGAWSIPSLTALAWSADGQRLVFTRMPGPGTRNWERREMAVVDVATGAVSPVRGATERRCGLAWRSPDGTQMVTSCPVDGHEKNQVELLALPFGGGTPKRLTVPIDRSFSRGVWRSDSKGVVASAPDGPISGLWEIPLEGSPRKLPLGRVAVSDLDLAPDGTIIFIGTESVRPAEIYALRPGASAPERLTEIHAEVAALTLGRVESFSWKNEGLPLDGVLTLPPNFDPSRKYPLVLNIHGGPWGSSREVFSTRSQLIAGKGFIVFEPNYRGSDNNGNALWSAVYRDHGDGPGRDVMAGLAILKSRPYVDTTRIGVSGWSYGGYMTTWLIGHYTGWKAAMAGAAVIDLVDDYNLNDLSLFIRAYGETLTMPADLALMKAQSPFTYLDKMTTPLLLLSNTGDVRVPVTQSYKLFIALRERGRDVRMKLWPVPGHFPADPWRARDIDREWAAWFVERLR